jgi:hypothetical protein
VPRDNAGILGLRGGLYYTTPQLGNGLLHEQLYQCILFYNNNLGFINIPIDILFNPKAIYKQRHNRPYNALTRQNMRL